MEPSTEVQDAYVQLLKALSGGDAAAFTARFSPQPGTLFFGTSPEEWIEGPSAVGEFAEGMVPALQRAGLTLHPGHPQGYREGSVGWVADRLTIRSASGHAQELRVSVVFREEDGRWKAVLYGHSLGVPDDQVEVFRELSA